MSKTAIAVLAAACALATGCGGEESNADRYEGEEAEVAAVVDRLQTAARDGDVKTICEELVTADLQRSVRQASGASCGEEFEQNVVSDDTTFRVESVNVDGETASANIVDQKDRRSQVAFAKVEGDWRIASIQ